MAYSYDPYLLPVSEQISTFVPLPLDPASQPPDDFRDSPWDPLFFASIVNAPGQLVDGAPHHLQPRFLNLRERAHYRWHFVKHHLAYAASAYLCAPFDHSAVMTLDGRGERATTTYGLADGLHYEQLGQVDMPHSLGLLYEEVTGYLGFLHSSDEYKVMALASFGQPMFVNEFRSLITIGPAGQFRIAPLQLEQRFGPRRLRGGPLDHRHYDLAHSLQVVLEETVLQLASWLHGETRRENLCIAGGVGLNCVMNARLRDRGPFQRVWVQPAAGDAGTALGAALYVDARERGASQRGYVMEHAFLGPSYSDAEIEAFLQWAKLPYRRLDNVAEAAAELLGSVGNPLRHVPTVAKWR